MGGAISSRGEAKILNKAVPSDATRPTREYRGEVDYWLASEK